MQRNRLRLINQIENYKAMEIAFRRNKNYAKAKECSDKIKTLQDALIIMTSRGITPEPPERAKNRKRTYFIIAFVVVLIASLVIALAVVTKENRELKQQVKDLTVMVTAERDPLPEPARGNVSRLESIGTFKIYHYCPCAECCGKTDGITATGTRAREGRTIAVDPTEIPLGTEVIIDGQEYVAEDTGSGIIGNKIDMFVGSHEEALQLGVDTVEVFIERR